MQECQKVQELLESYHDGELDEKSEKAVRNHLAGCEDCYNSYTKLLSLSEIIKETAQRAYEKEKSITKKVAGFIHRADFSFDVDS